MDAALSIDYIILIFVMMLIRPEITWAYTKGILKFKSNMTTCVGKCWLPKNEMKVAMINAWMLHYQMNILS